MNTQKISYETAALMIVTAVFADTLDFVALGGFLGIIVDFIFSTIFGIWFSHIDMSLMDGDRVGRFLTTAVIEAIPVVDDLPGFTIMVSTNIWEAWHAPVIG